MKRPLRSARLQLAWIWFPASALLFMIFVASSIGGVYGDEVQKFFSWALPNFLPTLSLMMSVFAQDALVQDEEQINRTYVRSSFLILASGLSLFYLALLFIVVIAAPFVSDDPFETIEMANVFLAPLQALVIGALGVLFFVRESDA